MNTFDVISKFKEAFEESGLKLAPQAFDGDSLMASAVDKSFCVLQPEVSGNDNETGSSSSKSKIISLNITVRGVVLHSLANKNVFYVIEKTAETFDKIVKAVLNMTGDGSIEKVVFVDSSPKQSGEFIQHIMTFKISYLIVND